MLWRDAALPGLRRRSRSRRWRLRVLCRVRLVGLRARTGQPRRWRLETGAVPVRIRRDRPVDPAAVVEIREGMLAPTDVQAAIFERDALGETLLGAAQALDETAATNLHDDHGMTACDGLYARSVAVYKRRRTSTHADRLLDLTQQLGRTVGGLPTELADVATGPVAVLAAASIRPTLEVRLPERFVDVVASEQRSRLLRYLADLDGGVEVVVTGSRIDLRRLLEAHGPDLPGDVAGRAQSRLRSTTSTRSVEEVAGGAIESIGTSDRTAGYWRTLQAVAEDLDPRVAVADLESHTLLDATAAGVRSRIKRLVDAGLLERVRPDGRSHVRTTAAGRAALFTLRDRSPHLLGGRPTESDGDRRADAGAETGGVVDPPNPTTDRVTPDAREGPPQPDRPAGEGEAAAGGGSTTAAPTRYLNLAEHHAVASMAPAGAGVALENQTHSAPTDRRGTWWSVDEDRSEVVAGAWAASSVAHLAARLCFALVNRKALSQVLTPENLDGGAAGRGLEGLAIDNPYVLRRGRTVGWLRDADASGRAFLERLTEARRELSRRLATAADRAEGGVYDGDDLRAALRDAHGLLGTVSAVYDLLGYEVVLEVRLPAAGTVERRELAEFLTRAASITSRKGAYTAHRILYEPRKDKREDALGAPDVEADDPTGGSSVSWVVSGPSADGLAAHLDDPGEFLELQEGSLNFAPFVVPLSVVDADRRAAHVEALARLEGFKGLERTRRAISLLRALTGGVRDVATAVGRMGCGDGRPLDDGDLRHGLRQLEPEAILPDVGGPTVSKAVAALLDGDARTTAELADAAGVSEQSLRNNRDRFEDLAALGLVAIEAAGPGKATTWRFTFPEDGDAATAAPIEPALSDAHPGYVDRETGPTALSTRLSDALFDVLALLDEATDRVLPVDLATAFMGPPGDRDLGEVVTAEPWLGRLTKTLAQLLDAEGRLPDGAGFGGSETPMELGQRPELATEQARIDAVAG